MTIYQPYVYIIRWTNANKGYIGARFAKECHPSDLFVSYYTSSKYVSQLISEFGLPDQIKIFPYPDKQTALLMEEKFQRRFRVLESDYWLNRNINGKGFSNCSSYVRTAEHRRKLSESKKGMIPWNKGVTHSAHTKQKIKDKRKDQIIQRHSEDTKKLLSENRIGDNNPNYRKTLYCFSNGKEEFIGTQCDFRKYTGTNRSSACALVKGRARSVRGWFLLNVVE